MNLIGEEFVPPKQEKSKKTSKMLLIAIAVVFVLIILIIVLKCIFNRKCTFYKVFKRLNC